VHLVSLRIEDFRCFTRAAFDLDPEGTTVITGRNGMGKTSLLEAVAYLATLQSFRGSPRDAMIRSGTEQAILRSETLVGERPLSIEAQISATGRSRTMVNRQAVRRRSELYEALRVTVFSPEDIGVVRGPPSERRRFLDDGLAVVDQRSASLSEDVDRILRQRAALLRQSNRRLSPEVAATLDVWDSRLATAGAALADAREALAQRLQPLVTEHYARLAGEDGPVALAYRRSWDGGLEEALAASRTEDLRRGVSLVGPHRDDLELLLAGLPTRTHSSQGEQRSVALALRLAAHQLATERLGSAPVLLLDDVFSELDPFRSRALLAGLPPGQALLTTALPPPPEVDAAKTFVVGENGSVSAASIRSAE
jgi:DNA replication and repair protein RecF